MLGFIKRYRNKRYVARLLRQLQSKSEQGDPARFLPRRMRLPDGSIGEWDEESRAYRVPPGQWDELSGTYRVPNPAEATGKESDSSRSLMIAGYRVVVEGKTHVLAADKVTPLYPCKGG